MFIDFKKELESASKGMIMIHDPKLLIKLIIRMIVRKLKVKHAGMLLLDTKKEHYVLSVSRGEAGIKIPQGFTRFTKDNPIIRLFSEKQFRHLINDRNAIVLEDITRMIWGENIIEKDPKVTKLLTGVNEQMEMLNSTGCVPAYYQNKLLAVLLLGEKYDRSKFLQEELDFFSALASDAAMAIRNAQLFEDLRKEADRNRKQYMRTVVVLGSTIEAKDKYTHGHTERVTQYSLAIARKMAADHLLEVSETFFERLYIGALLHDIGKIGIPETILNKNGKLTEEEYAVIKGHPAKGAEIIRPLELHEDCVNGVRHHHERYDGTGYPDGLKGEAIPLVSAIIATADAYDAMTTDRPYRRALTRDTAINIIQSNSGTQFHPKVTDVFVDLTRRGVL
jgi:putative nucleotidyltransferase with HDIG domain